MRKYIKHLLKCEKDFADVFSLFSRRFKSEIADTAAGLCFEVSRHGLWLAHNPHAERTYSSKGQLLEPGVVYVEKGHWPVAMFSADGGFTISGVDRRGPEMLQVMAAM